MKNSLSNYNLIHFFQMNVEFSERSCGQHSYFLAPFVETKSDKEKKNYRKANFL